jgi:hypothetical protein
MRCLHHRKPSSTCAAQGGDTSPAYLVDGQLQAGHRRMRHREAWVCGDHARRATLRGLARTDSAAGLGQHRRPPDSFSLPHITGRQSAEAVFLGLNWPNDPGKLFSIFDFFK